jgi:hypothetical protein
MFVHNESLNTPVGIKNKQPKALLISPTFFDYYKDIGKEFEKLGFEFFWMNTWLSKNPIYKILLRVAPVLVSKLSTAQYIRNIEDLNLDNVAEILVVKGEGLSINFIHYLRRKFPVASLSLYLWDGVENTRGVVNIAPAFDKVSTFDPKDAKIFGWHYRPLFARRAEEMQTTPNTQVKYDWAFIGSLHSDRFAVLRRLTRIETMQSFFAFGFIPGSFMWVLRHLTNLNLWCHGSIEISIKAISPDQVNSIAESSRSVVDIEHPRQRGLTMRSIETLLIGRKLITTNVEIKNSDLFDESRVYVIDRKNPSIPREFINSPFLQIPQEIRARYYIKNWLSDVICIPGNNPPPYSISTT